MEFYEDKKRTMKKLHRLDFYILIKYIFPDVP